MFSIDARSKLLFQQQWQGMLSEYVTRVAWSPDGILVASSAAGEVVVWQENSLATLLPPTDQSIDCLAFSVDGQFLAAGGQDGKVRVWKFKEKPELIATLDNAPKWVDRLSWNPTKNQLAYSFGRSVQIWDAETQRVIATLPFMDSSILCMSWRPNGQSLAIAGNKGAKIWDATNWDDDPYVMDMPAASIAIAWSEDGKYIASGNLDNTITVLEWGNPNPWVMRGFPGKIRNLAWSRSFNNNAPLLAASSVEGIAVWKKEAKEIDGWNARVLTLHDGVIEGLAFQPNSLLLASAADDGWLCLWEKAKQVGQILDEVPEGFSCLAWHPQGKQLAAGGQQGELLVWTESKRGKGFG
ncbi:hypothetical protein IQ238_15670 [Pleurocapsales cyanobacterium LEGE 06147]|nr:hypothetical protein [Pleurocapsales cyanobacterium LEGE 06147]